MTVPSLTAMELATFEFTDPIDIALRKGRLVSEIDGRLHETDVDVFETDPTRQNALVLDGWLVLRFTWYLLDQHPGYVVATTRRALEARRVADTTP